MAAVEVIEPVDPNSRRAFDLSEREKRRDQVTAMMLAHTPYRTMASMLGVAVSTIAADVQVIRKRWIANSLRSYETHVSQMTALLDGIERAMAPKAMLGDPKAAEVLMRVADRRARLLGLDRPTRVEVQGEVTISIEALLAEGEQAADELAERRRLAIEA